VADSNRAQQLPSVSICLPLAPGSVEGGKRGVGGGHEQHTSSVPELHGDRLPVTDTAEALRSAAGATAAGRRC